MTSQWLPVVAVPARNEVERLPRLLAALAGQRGIGRGVALPVVLVCNNCTDGTAAAACRVGDDLPGLDLEVVEVDFPHALAHVGSARKLALELAMARAADPARAVLLTTDADAVPDPGWVSGNLAAIAAGADLVGGRLVGDPGEEARLGQAFVRRAARQLRYAALVDRLACFVDPLSHDPAPRHWDHTGGSLAMRGDVCIALGGLRAVPFREDLDLVSRARAAGFRLRHAPDVVVSVSARLDGRARGGMADCLRDWVAAEAHGMAHCVEAPGAIAARLALRRGLRRIDGMAPCERSRHLAALGLPAAALPSDAAISTGSALVEIFAPDEPDAPCTVPVEAAIARLEALLEALLAEHEGGVIAA